MIYAGIGSRDTPDDVLDQFEYLGRWLGERGHILRSGHADGADSAFERGCAKVCGRMEIYLPWRGFNGSASPLVFQESDRSMEIARTFHPNFAALGQGAQKLQARNSYQILGYDLNKPADFVICWTKSGLGRGGTGQAIRIANHYNVPVFDFGAYESLSEARLEFNIFLKNARNKVNESTIWW